MSYTTDTDSHSLIITCGILEKIVALITRKEREKLIRKISKASGTTQYAIGAKLSDESLLELDKPEAITILSLMKPATWAMRDQQRRKTGDANRLVESYKDRIDQLTKFGESEILNTAKRIAKALGFSGQKRFEALKVEKVVHADDYNELHDNLEAEVKENIAAREQLKDIYSKNIKAKDSRIDTLKKASEQ